MTRARRLAVDDHLPVAGHVCTLRSNPLARSVQGALIATAVIGAAWLAATLVGGPYLVDSLVVEVIIATVVLLDGVLLATSLGRALGCGRCHTPECRCS